MTKYEVEQESKRKIDYLNLKIITLEKELNQLMLRETEYKKKEKQLDKIKRELTE